MQSQFNIRNDDTNENIEIFGELKMTPKKSRYNEKIPMNNRVVKQYNGFIVDGSFSVVFCDYNNYNKIHNSWKSDNMLLIQDIDGKRYYVTIVGDTLDLTPNQNNVTNEVYYVGNISLKGGLYG